MGAKTHKKTTGSPKVEVGEIDTRAPFQSVKDAVTLFGEGALSGEKPAPIKKAKPHSAERVFAKETQLHLARKALNKLKEQLQNAESTKAQALVELEKANRTVEDLTFKLQTLHNSKEVAIKSTEAAKNRAIQIEGATNRDGGWKHELEITRANYMNAITELDAAKQDLRQIQRDCNKFLMEKEAAFTEAMEAENAIEANTKRASELSKEITDIQNSIGDIYADDPELTNTRKLQLAEMLAQIGQLSCLKNITSDLDGAKESLRKVAEEEISLRTSLETLKLELVNVKNEHSKLKEKEIEKQSLSGNLHIKLRKSKSELESSLVEELKAKGATEEIMLMLEQLTMECVDGKHESEETIKKSEELKIEAVATRIALEAAENNLQAALDEVEEAKADEARALDQIKTLSEATDAARASGARITISIQEFDSLTKKVEASEKLAEMKVAAALAQVQAVKASENDALERLEATRKEIEDVKVATREALKSADMAEAAKRAVDGELKKWREREQEKAVEAGFRVLERTEVSGTRKKNPLSRKAIILPNLVGIFQRKKKKKNQIKGGGDLSYLPGEEPL